MLLLSVTRGKVGILSSLQRDLKIDSKLVLNLIFFTASVISILHDSPSVSVCFLANWTVYGGFLHRLGRKKRKKSQPVSSLHKKPAANENDNSETLCVMDKTRKLSNAQQGCFLSFTGVICGRCAPKKKSGRNLSCGHGNSTGNRKSLTIRVQVGILRTLRLSCHKRYAQISITSQLYHKILWLSRKGQLTATWKSIPSGDIHTPEAVQKTAATGAGSQHAPTGLPFLWNVRFLSAGAHPAQCPPA